MKTRFKVKNLVNVCIKKNHLEYERLIGWSRRIQALRLISRAPIHKRGSSEVEFSRPVHRPIRRQEIRAAFLSSNRQITAGDLQLLDTDTTSSCRNRHHRVVLWRQEHITLIHVCDQSYKPRPSPQLLPIRVEWCEWVVWSLYHWLDAVSRSGHWRVCRWNCLLYTRRRRPEQHRSPKPGHIPPPAEEQNKHRKWFRPVLCSSKEDEGSHRRKRSRAREEEEEKLTEEEEQKKRKWGRRAEEKEQRKKNRERITKEKEMLRKTGRRMEENKQKKKNRSEGNEEEWRK